MMKAYRMLARASMALMFGIAGLVTLASPPARADDKPSLLAAPRNDARPSMESMQIPSHGSLVNGLVYVAAGATPHPVVILLHGFPGNERNLDLAQDIRRAGWDVMYFNYRGSWGSPGDFSFAHGIEDVGSAIAYLRDPANAARLRVDPSRIVLVGHSMGGFMAVQAAAADPSIKAVAMISGADMAGAFQHIRAQGPAANAVHDMGAALAKEGMAPLSGCTPDSLASELSDHADDWVFPARAAAIKDRPVFIMSSDDGLAAANDAFAKALVRAGDRKVTTRHLPTDHAYSDQRTALSRDVLAWLATLK